MTAKYELKKGMTLEELGHLDDAGWKVIKLMMVAPAPGKHSPDNDCLLDALMRIEIDDDQD